MSVSSWRTRPSLPRSPEQLPAPPVLAVVDDLHAAERTPRSLCCSSLAGDLHRMPALFLFTVRDTEPSRSLGQALGRCRPPRCRTGGGSAPRAADVAALLERLTVESPHADVVSAPWTAPAATVYTTSWSRLVSSEHRRRPLIGADVLALERARVASVTSCCAAGSPAPGRHPVRCSWSPRIAGRELRPELLQHVTGLDAGTCCSTSSLPSLRASSTSDQTGWGFREFAQAWRLATDVLHSPELQDSCASHSACRYFFAGDVERFRHRRAWLSVPDGRDRHLAGSRPGSSWTAA